MARIVLGKARKISPNHNASACCSALQTAPRLFGRALEMLLPSRSRTTQPASSAVRAIVVQ
eukprot:1460645-Prymnesium_polylepis.1